MTAKIKKRSTDFKLRRAITHQPHDHHHEDADAQGDCQAFVEFANLIYRNKVKFNQTRRNSKFFGLQEKKTSICRRAKK